MTTRNSDIEIIQTTGRRSATARLRQGIITVSVPRHWSKTLKQEIVTQLVDRVERQTEKQRRLLKALSLNERMTLPDKDALLAYIRQLNRETYNVPLKGVRVGHARYSRLAQANLETGIITVSKFCLHDVPEQALRYLLVHELAHFIERSHDKRFWGLVARYVPDYRRQSRIMEAVHAYNSGQLERVAVNAPIAPAPQPKPSFMQRLADGMSQTLGKQLQLFE